MNTQIWQHKTSGDRYAVSIDSTTGVVIDVWAGLTDEDMAELLTGEDWESGLDPETLEAACDEMNINGDEYRLVFSLVTLTVDDLPLFASKNVASGEYVEVEADSPEANSYSVTRAHMGVAQWQAIGLTAAEVIETVTEWGVQGWTPALHGEYA